MPTFVTLENGDRLYIDELGVERGSPLLCLHGLGGGGYFFSNLAQAQSAKRRIICPDMPGSGFSPRGDLAISFERFADVIVSLIEQNTAGPIALLGHSMGTITALKVYARIPSRIAAMIFVGGVPTPLPEAQARLRDRAAIARKEGMLAVAPTIPPVVFAQRSLIEIPDKVTMFQRLLAASDAEGYAQTALALAGASAADVIERVDVPCLCLTGAEDRYAPPPAVRNFASQIRGAVLHELAGCGHMPFFEDPPTFNHLVDHFLAAR
ncbi:MAG TPA: alpha/beta hydrolase [Humisphaera sp.]|jgi:3-oxoadipate enol-lactonase|nr:alpha/beta hydrolase [Humisphaera sp.]